MNTELRNNDFKNLNEKMVKTIIVIIIPKRTSRLKYLPISK